MNSSLPAAHFRKWVATIVCLCTASTLAIVAPAQGQAPASPGTIAAKLQPFVDHQTMAGAVVLVADKQRVLNVEAVGYADIEAKRPMRPDALFWIASMSKPMTCTALMMLVDEGKLGVDDPVEKYLPEFKNAMVLVEQDENQKLLKRPTEPMRVRHLLSHTSGLPGGTPLLQPTCDALPLRSVVIGNTLVPLLGEPGTKYQYSNLGMNTVGRLVEVISGMPYERFLEERLFKPLGMKDTAFVLNRAQVDRLATSYRANATKNGLEATTVTALTYPLDRPDRNPFPGGGLFSTAADVGRFGQMLLNDGIFEGKRYLSEAAIRQMSVKQTPDSIPTPYGFGFSISGPGIFGHGGAYKTNLTVDRNLGLVTVFMVQQANDWPNAPEGAKIMGTFRTEASRLALAELMAKAPAAAAGTPVMEDKFTYTAATLDGHHPALGGDAWRVSAAAECGIAADGSRATVHTAGGKPGGKGDVVASYPFTPAPDTLYTLTMNCELKPAGPKADCWAALGFARDAAAREADAWLLLRPQVTEVDDAAAVALANVPPKGASQGSIYAGCYPALTVVLTLNTKSNVVEYFVDGLPRGRATLTAPAIHHLFVKGYRTGDAFTIKGVKLTAQPVQ